MIDNIDTLSHKNIIEFSLNSSCEMVGIFPTLSFYYMGGIYVFQESEGMKISDNM